MDHFGSVGFVFCINFYYDFLQCLIQAPTYHRMVCLKGTRCNYFKFHQGSSNPCELYHGWMQHIDIADFHTDKRPDVVLNIVDNNSRGLAIPISQLLFSCVAHSARQGGSSTKPIQLPSYCKMLTMHIWLACTLLTLTLRAT